MHFGSFYTVTQAQISVEAGITYGTDIEEIGLQASGTYVLNEEMRLGAGARLPIN